MIVYYTPDLSTLCSIQGILLLSNEKSHLGIDFAFLDAFHRLFMPYIALYTQLCAPLGRVTTVGVVGGVHHQRGRGEVGPFRSSRTREQLLSNFLYPWQRDRNQTQTVVSQRSEPSSRTGALMSARKQP